MAAEISAEEEEAPCNMFFSSALSLEGIPITASLSLYILIIAA